jgi:hypothetical protein
MNTNSASKGSPKVLLTGAAGFIGSHVADLPGSRFFSRSISKDKKVRNQRVALRVRSPAASAPISNSNNLSSGGEMFP